jgi:hypothetical protein
MPVLPSAPLPTRGAPASAPPGATAVVDEQGLDAAVASVAGSRERWANTSVPERVGLLERVIVDTLAAAPEWIADACRAKGIALGTPAVGEEWINLAIAVRNARLLRDSLRDIGRARAPAAARPAGGGSRGPGRGAGVPRERLRPHALPRAQGRRCGCRRAARRAR